MERFLSTDETNSALLVQRVLLGIVFFPHGAQKLLGWFGGFGFSDTMGFFTTQAGLPWIIAFLVIMGESFGSLMLVAGLLTRLAALGISAVMLGAIFTVHLQHGFFMNWAGNQKGEGLEYHLLALGLSIPIVIWGGGRYALDSVVLKHSRSTAAGAAPAPHSATH
jgi:putative oxidoreductase